MPFQVVFSGQLTSHNIHFHTNYELLYIAEGEISMRIGSRSFHMRSGDMIFLNQFQEHATTLLSDVYQRYYLLIPPQQLPSFHECAALFSIFRLHGEDFPYVLHTAESRKHFDMYFSLLWDAFRQTSDYRDQQLHALITLILTEAWHLKPDMFGRQMHAAPFSIRDVMDELDQYFTDEFSLQELAEKHHVSPGCLSRHFRRYVGMSPMQYVTQSRLTRAKHLLLTTDLPVGAVSDACGYQDTSNFIRLFRTKFGDSPLQFRFRNREESSVCATASQSDDAGK